MFYHDHAFGITRLQVYAGMAAPYLLHDAAEDALISAGAFPTGGGAFGAGNPKPQGQEVDGNAGPGENSKRSSGKSCIERAGAPLTLPLARANRHKLPAWVGENWQIGDL